MFGVKTGLGSGVDFISFDFERVPLLEIKLTVNGCHRRLRFQNKDRIYDFRLYSFVTRLVYFVMPGELSSAQLSPKVKVTKIHHQKFPGL